ncbi:Metallo-dependent phosphatase, partial [Clavulina sp. PMI_390]
MDALISRLQNARISDLSSPVSELITENSRVYLHYDVTNPPLHPGPEFTRFVCISDNHGATPRVPRGDVLIHSGDLSMYARKKSRDATMTWLKALPHPVKLVIAGNHDRMLDPEIYEAEGDPEHYQNMRSQLVGDAAVAAKINYLQFESAIIPPASWKAFGSPATPWYSAGAFQYWENEAQAVNSLIPEDTQILLTHGPPKGILDQSKRGKSVGCPELTRPGGWLPHVRLHVFGHIHEAWGAQI